MEKIYDINYSTEVVTDHPIWAKPYVNGRIRAFFVPSIHFGREIIELVQRMELDYETVTIDRSWDSNKWGLGDYYDKRGAIWDFEIMYKNLENALVSDEHFDVMVIPGINGWGCFTEKTRQAILKRVEEGAGLILIHPFTGEGLEKTEVLEKLSPMLPLYEEGLNDSGYPEIKRDKLETGKWIPKKHYITNGIPFDLVDFSELSYYPYEALGEVIIESGSGKPIAAVKEYGKGRIVSFGYVPRDILPAYNFREGGSCFGSINMGETSGERNLRFDYREYFYGLMGRSIIWASKREPECIIEGVNTDNGKLCVNISKNCGLSLSCRVKNLYDKTVAETELDGTELIFPEWMKLGGEYRIELFAKKDGKIADWYVACVKYPLKAAIKEICLDRDTTVPGDIIKGRVEVEGTDSTLTISMLDDFENVLCSETLSTEGRRVFEREYFVKSVKSLNIRLLAELSLDGFTLHKAESARTIVIPQDRKIHDFEVFLSPVFRGRPEFLQFLGKLFRSMGVTGLYPGDYKMVAGSGASGLGIYWYHRAPYVERKENYLRTKDKKYLYRDPCLNSQEFWKSNEENINKTVSENKKFGPISYFANDEGSLTCYTDELELCFCPNCMSKMREWLKSEYKSLEELNSEWGTDFKEWDQVEPYTAEEARKKAEYASWGDHRRFMETVFANAYKRISQAVKAEDPEGTIRMSGCQASTPYSGYDYYQLHQHIGYFEAYESGNQIEFHRSFARPGTIIGGWTGYGVSGVNAKHQIWGRMLHGLTLMSIFWQYACINPDFTYSKSAVDMGKAFKEIRREGIGKLLLYTANRDDLGIALHYSMPSIHGSYIIGDEQRFKDNREGWVNLLEDMGYQYNFVATQQIEAGELIEKGYKVLILPYSIALSEKETIEIKRFAENGGTVIGDLQTGIMDVHNKLFDKGSLDEFFGIERYTTEAKPFYTNREFMKDKRFDYFDAPDISSGSDLYFAESGTRASVGKAAYHQDFSGTVPGVVVSVHGKGKAVYLNSCMNEYPVQRKECKGGFYTRKVMKSLLTFAGVEKFCSLTDMDGAPMENGYETVYYSDGKARYIAVIRDFDNQLSFGHDGLAVGGGSDEEGAAEAVKLVLPEKAHVYDVRSKKYLGFTDSVDTGILPGDTKVFSVLPYAFSRISLEMPDEVKAGSTLELAIKLDQGSKDIDYTNVLCISFYEPSGEYGWQYSENAAVKGELAIRRYDLPLNEKEGLWRVVVKDVATGVSCEKSFTVTRG